MAQIPVFISLFYMLRQDLRKNICPQTQAAYQAKYAAAHHITLAQAAGHTTPCGANNGAGFLFIPDLTDKATGWVLIVLLLLYVGTQLASSLMMSSPMMDKQQRNLMMLLPLVFVVIVIRFPAGLIVYWITTNTWTMAQQYTVRRMIGTPPTAGGYRRRRPTGRRPRGWSWQRPRRYRWRRSATPDDSGPNGSGGSGGGGGLSGLIRGRAKREPEPVAAASGRSGKGGTPPPPPRKKKKRSGRRR